MDEWNAIFNLRAQELDLENENNRRI